MSRSGGPRSNGAERAYLRPPTVDAGLADTDTMRILIIGGGGREHALAWKIAQSPRVEGLFAAPGNPGIARHAACVPLAADALDGLVAFAKRERIDLAVVGPEAPLVAGLADRFIEAGLAVFGPVAPAAAIEGSKAFAKRLMAHHGIPTARFATFDDAARGGPGPQDRVRRRPGSEHRWHGCLLAGGGVRRGDGAPRDGDDRASDDHGARQGERALPGRSLRRAHADRGGTEGPRVQLPLRRPRVSGAPGPRSGRPGPAARRGRPRRAVARGWPLAGAGLSLRRARLRRLSRQVPDGRDHRRRRGGRSVAGRGGLPCGHRAPRPASGHGGRPRAQRHRGGRRPRDRHRARLWRGRGDPLRGDALPERHRAKEIGVTRSVRVGIVPGSDADLEVMLEAVKVPDAPE